MCVKCLITLLCCKTPCSSHWWTLLIQALRQHTADTDITVTAATLGTLSRVASACARLHLRDVVLATPDVVLSIMLLEESFQHQVRSMLTCKEAESPASLDSLCCSVCTSKGVCCNTIECHAMCTAVTSHNMPGAKFSLHVIRRRPAA